jgi:hypothetical protein
MLNVVFKIVFIKWAHSNSVAVSIRKVMGPAMNTGTNKCGPIQHALKLPKKRWAHPHIVVTAHPILAAASICSVHFYLMLNEPSKKNIHIYW